MILKVENTLKKKVKYLPIIDQSLLVLKKIARDTDCVQWAAHTSLVVVIMDAPHL